MINRFVNGLLLALCMVVLAGCSLNSSNTGLQETVVLKVGMMPAVDAAPVLVAQEQGYFEEFGVTVEIEIFNNAVNRQSALQTGQLDGALSDLVAVINNIQNGFGMKVTSSTDGSFPFLVKKGFVENDEVRVGMMQVSVTNYLSDRMLGDAYRLQKVYIDEIPARLEMVKTGNIDMACIPEPMASMGVLNGLEKRIYDNPSEFLPGVMVFTDDALESKTQAIAAFYQALDKAAALIQEEESQARRVLIEKLALNPAIEELIDLPRYHSTRVPDEGYIQELIDWIVSTQNTSITLSYDAIVEGKFVTR